jgi:hypothetical protein
MALAPVAMRNEGVPDSIATYNTGVMGVYCLYETVIRQWLEATRHNDDDQHAMRWLIHNAGLKIATLLPRYNFRPKFPAYLSGKPVIIHNRQGDNKKIFKRANKGHWKP